MRIAMIAPIGERVPPPGYGGTERIVAWLTEALVRRGHTVTLFATADSQTAARLDGWPERPLRGLVDIQHHIAMEMAQGLRCESRLADFDIAHCHLGAEGASITRFWPLPTLHTMHGGIFPDQVPLLRALPELAWISISDAQRRPAPGLNWVSTIHHGLPLASYPYDGAKADYLLHLGRIAPEKGTHLAIDAAKRAGRPLVIAAKIDPVNADYFDEAIRPRLVEGEVDYVGEVDHDQKIALLRKAAGLLFPILWEEPFGIVMVEALACGTPVVAYERGSVPEVVVRGQTGYIVADLDGMVSAISRLDRLDPLTCRRHVEAHFSVERMADQYETLYARCAGAPAMRVA